MTDTSLDGDSSVTVELIGDLEFTTHVEGDPSVVVDVDPEAVGG